MRIQLQIPDDLYDLFVIRASEMGAKGAAVSTEEAMVDTLTRFAAISPSERAIVIGAEGRRRLEQVLSGGSLFDATDLCDKVEALAKLEIGNVKMEFTPGQMKQLSHYARRNSKKVEEIVRETVKKMEWQFFDHMGGGKQ